MPSALVWFRRDLRVDDHAALHHALAGFDAVWCVFVFDTRIIAALPAAAHRRALLLHAACQELHELLVLRGGGLIVRHGEAVGEIVATARALGVATVMANRDYEPEAIARDRAAGSALATEGIGFRTFKDQVVFEHTEIATLSGTPFSVFTPYRKAWMKRLATIGDATHAPLDTAASHGRLAAPPAGSGFVGVPDPALLGIRVPESATPGLIPGAAAARRRWDEFLDRIDDYDQRRDFPAIKGPSYLSTDLRFGTLSIRTLTRVAAARASNGAATWLSELIWREFYFMILAEHPRVTTRAFRPEYEHLVFDDNEAYWAAWCEGRTGYPIVDAAMRQLNTSGYMHNRLRMIVASFLVKDLQIDWRHGEGYFRMHLNDHDLSANNGGWQWAASTGCDSQPYFRIFNPVTQSQRFDPQGRFIRRYVPELAAVPDRWIHAPWEMPPIEQTTLGCQIGRDYPAPIVDHATARALTLERYRLAREAAAGTG
jgi:deoxyribodipyrimidine photo-lyase